MNYNGYETLEVQLNGLIEFYIIKNKNASVFYSLIPQTSKLHF